MKAEAFRLWREIDERQVNKAREVTPGGMLIQAGSCSRSSPAKAAFSASSKACESPMLLRAEEMEAKAKHCQNIEFVSIPPLQTK